MLFDEYAEDRHELDDNGQRSVNTSYTLTKFALSRWCKQFRRLPLWKKRIHKEVFRVWSLGPEVQRTVSKWANCFAFKFTRMNFNGVAFQRHATRCSNAMIPAGNSPRTSHRSLQWTWLTKRAKRSPLLVVRTFITLPVAASPNVGDQKLRISKGCPMNIHGEHSWRTWSTLMMNVRDAL